MKKIRQLSILKQVAIYTTIATLVLFVGTSVCFWFNLMEIPLGILLGGVGSSLSFAIFTIKENSLSDRLLMKLTILCVIIMALIHISTIVLAGCLYYVADLHIFNLFATFGASFIGLIVFVTLSLIQKKGE